MLFLLFLFLADTSAAADDGSDSKYTLRIICDDEMTLWVDGEQRDVTGQNAWDEVSTLNISSTTQVLGVKCFNTFAYFGIMADVTDEAGKEIPVTDDSWTCSNTADEGWFRAEFHEGGNWRPASYVSDHRFYTNHSSSWPWASMSPNRHVIWTNSGNDTTVYCRKTLTSGLDSKYTLRIICDDEMTLWVDGEQKYVAGLDVWDMVSTLTISSTTQVLGAKCVDDWGGGYGIMADVTDEAGKEILVTDDSWTCSNTADEGWQLANFHEGDNWKPATYVTDNNYYMDNSDSRPWASMSPNRHVIWTSGNDTTVYCRRTMTSSRIDAGKLYEVVC